LTPDTFTTPIPKSNGDKVLVVPTWRADGQRLYRLDWIYRIIGICRVD
jgi:hypothetical protein